MNSKTSYEILITEKAAQLPIPDMADVIWNRIEAGLEAAAQENIDTPSKQKVRSRPAPRNVVRNGILITAAAVITVIAVWLIKKRKKNTENNKPIPAINEPVKEKVTTDSNTIVLPPLKKTALPVKNDTKIIDGPGISKIDSLNLVSTPFQQQQAGIRNDSLIIPSSRPGPLIDASKTALPQVAKPKGVKGISDSDYKIIMTKKDSADRKN